MTDQEHNDDADNLTLIEWFTAKYPEAMAKARKELKEQIAKEGLTPRKRVRKWLRPGVPTPDE